MAYNKLSEILSETFALLTFSHASQIVVKSVAQGTHYLNPKLKAKVLIPGWCVEGLRSVSVHELTAEGKRIPKTQLEVALPALEAEPSCVRLMISPN